MMTPEERKRQDLYNQYVTWRLELLYSNPTIDPTTVSNFDEWCEVCNVVASNQKPKIRKRKTNDRKKK